MAKIGYARVSTIDQKLGRQTEILNKFEVDKIYFEKVSGGKTNRPEFNKMMNELSQGDIVVVAELTRLSRSTSQLIAVCEEFKKREVQLISLKENIDTTTPSGRLMFGMLAVLAQFEREIIVERTKEGLAIAKQKGVRMGRPPVNNDRMDLAVELWASGRYTVSEITRKTGVTKAPLYREINRRELTREVAL
ncbi:MAG: hypothetical protein K0S71_340 [Clostridia bacterium]|jgi:DNA invertase Pin-like site-specific DNA recombinase|nr:hypothetical protein [Clostridia bacterium]